MQEMYDWYMDNLFGEHYKQAVKHAEKDGRDRTKRRAKQGPSLRQPVTDFSQANLYRMATHAYDRNYSGATKWERIGSPITASVIDWAIIINPYGWKSPSGMRLKLRAAERQYDRYEEYFN